MMQSLVTCKFLQMLNCAEFCFLVHAEVNAQNAIT